jgi:6-pyruvoyltetrahydropterin/6-carboxytetrahydropterin synthase
MRYEISITEKFDAAHYLPKYKGDCSRMHGHTWKIKVHFLYSTRALKNGMSIDFKVLKKALKEILPDHLLLNVKIQDPTAENLAQYFFNEIKKHEFPIYKLELWESENSSVIITDED